MVTMIGWISLADYAFEDYNEISRLKKTIQSRLKGLKLGNSTKELKTINGTTFLQISMNTNHLNEGVEKLIDLFYFISESSPYPFGLIHFTNDEDDSLYDNFKVYKIAKGEVKIVVDELLSPHSLMIE